LPKKAILGYSCKENGDKMSKESKNSQGKKYTGIAFYDRPEYQEILEEFRQETPRGGIIIGHAQLEILLEKLLLSRLVINKEIEAITKGLNFDSKNNICYAIGAISKIEYDDLKKINRIRNKFAHYPEYKDFNNLKIQALCSDLKIAINIFNKLKETGKDVGYDRASLKDKIEASLAFLILTLDNKIRNSTRFQECDKPFRS
jgi:hypothetical protein